MVKKIYVKLIGILLFAVLSSCSKNDAGTDNPGGGIYPSDLRGTIYYDWASEGILQFSLPDGVGSSFIPDNSKLNNFDVSRDGKTKLTVVDAGSLGQYDVRFTISDIGNGSIIEEFIYNSPAGNRYCKGFLSPDASLILVTSNDTEDGITILKRNGEFVTRINNINGEEIDFNINVLWLPDNELVLKHGKFIIRIPAPYTGGRLVKEMEYADWDHLTVNQAGTQFALQLANHIHTMNVDGTGLKQVTTSNFKESVPTFSPDGKYLLVGANYRQTGPFGFVWDMKIIPNDGQQYDVDPVAANSPGVIPILINGRERIEMAGGQMLWQ